MNVITSFARAIGMLVLAIAGVLATIAGCVTAINYGIDAVGPYATTVAGALLVGGVIGAAVVIAHHSRELDAAPPTDGTTS